MLRVVYLADRGSNVNSQWLNRFFDTNSKTLSHLSCGVLIALSLYVLTPTVTKLIFGSKMFSSSSKRADKYTTGLINNRNDCFANCSVQALASLPGLTSYLNEFLRQVSNAVALINGNPTDKQPPRGNSQFLDNGILTPRVEIENNPIDNHQSLDSGVLTPRLEIKENPIDSHQSLDRLVSNAVRKSKSSGSVSTLQDEATGDHTPALSTAQHSLNNAEESSEETDDETTEPKIPRILMHQSLASMLSQLQETITSSRHISVWPLLHVLEIIFNAKISTGQNDAHELTQVILETLQKENSKLRKFVKSRGVDVSIPELPFGGELADHLVCMKCTNSSKVNVHPFIIYPLTVPHSMSAKLSDMVSDNQTDTIEGYSCLTCKVSTIVNCEKGREARTRSEEENKILKTLEAALPDMSINDELSDELTAYINAYSRDGVVAADLKSTIVKKTVVVESPKTLVMHLSRSMFDGISYQRNSCGVAFDEVLESQEQVIRHNKCVGINPISYKLKAIVAHSGSHSQGHYECYRHKPDFVKDVTTKTVINRSPTIDVSLITPEQSKDTNGAQKQSERTSPQDYIPDSKFTLNAAALPMQSNGSNGSNNDDYVIGGSDSSKVSRKPSAIKKLTGFLSRRGSVTGENDDSSADIQAPASIPRSRAGSIANSDYGRSRAGSVSSTHMRRTTSIESQSSYLNSSESNFGTTSASDADVVPGDSRILKKIKSVVKYPYWHISDAEVKEAKTDQVLGEVRYVYMLYYERLGI